MGSVIALYQDEPILALHNEAVRQTMFELEKSAEPGAPVWLSMSYNTKFAVSRFENRNGVTSWRVSGFLHGVRIRWNFKNRAERWLGVGHLPPNSVQFSIGT